MKRILIAAILGLICTTALGAKFAARNEGGGQIVLTRQPCGSTKGARLLYAYTARGTTLFACWVFDSDTKAIIAKYTDGSIRVYPIAEFHKIGGDHE